MGEMSVGSDSVAHVAQLSGWNRESLNRFVGVGGWHQKNLSVWSGKLGLQHHAVRRTEAYAQQDRDRVKKVKAYEPGFLHMDLSYCLTLDGVRPCSLLGIEGSGRLVF